VDSGHHWTAARKKHQPLASPCFSYPSPQLCAHAPRVRHAHTSFSCILASRQPNLWRQPHPSHITHVTSTTGQVFRVCGRPNNLEKPTKVALNLRARGGAAWLHLAPPAAFLARKKAQHAGPGTLPLTLAARAAEVEYKREDARDNMSGRDKNSGLRYPTLHVNSHSR
jgi:hypothetical protein